MIQAIAVEVRANHHLQVLLPLHQVKAIGGKRKRSITIASEMRLIYALINS